jgi:hypothetical protein
VKGRPASVVERAAEVGRSGLGDSEEVNSDRLQESTPDRESAATPDSGSDEDIDLSRQLSSKHVAMLLKESGISRRVAKERGYRTI